MLAVGHQRSVNLLTLLVGAVSRVNDQHVRTVNKLTSDGSGNNLTPCLASHVDVRQITGVVKDLTDDLG